MNDLDKFYIKHQGNRLLDRNILTQTLQGRDLPLLLIGNKNAEKNILFTARHHACESTASYMLEGLLTYLLEHDQLALLKEYLIHVVPFVDLDGVENGDQGKGRFPHDHNRDYIDEPIYRATKAIMEYGSQIKPVVAIDFHSPWIRGGRNDHPFFVKYESPVKEELEKLALLLKQKTHNNKIKNDIAYEIVYDIKMGEDWHQPGTQSFSSFFFNTGAQIACTFEFPYFGNNEIVYTQSNCRRFGVDFASALVDYLEK